MFFHLNFSQLHLVAIFENLLSKVNGSEGKSKGTSDANLVPRALRVRSSQRKIFRRELLTRRALGTRLIRRREILTLTPPPASPSVPPSCMSRMRTKPVISGLLPFVYVFADELEVVLEDIETIKRWIDTKKQSEAEVMWVFRARNE